MRDKIEDWLGGLLFLVVFFLVMIILVVIIVFSPVASILNRIKRAIAMTGLKSEQKGLLMELSRYRVLFLSKIAQELSDDEDYGQAQMRSSAEGYAVLFVKERIRELREADIEKLISDCHKAGIAKWQIRLVKPRDL